MTIPYLIVRDGQSALDFYQAALDARITFEPMLDEAGRVGHSEFVLPDSSRFMLADEHPEHGIHAPAADTGAGLLLVHMTPTVEADAERFAKAGGEILSEVADDGHGGRSARFRDPYGFVWILSEAR